MCPLAPIVVKILEEIVAESGRKPHIKAKRVLLKTKKPNFRWAFPIINY